MILFFQDNIDVINGVERLIKLREASVIGVLLLVIVYFIYEKRQLKKSNDKKEAYKDQRIKEITENHLKDQRYFAERYVDFFDKMGMWMNQNNRKN